MTIRLAATRRGTQDLMSRDAHASGLRLNDWLQNSGNGPLIPHIEPDLRYTGDHAQGSPTFTRTRRIRYVQSDDPP